MSTELQIKPEHIAIYRLEDEIKKQPQVPTPIEHDFIPGVYARTMYLMKGTILTGAVHKEASFFLMRSGILAVTTDFGEKLLGPGEMLKSSPGSKRAGLAFTDVVLTEFMYNPDNLTDPADLWHNYTDDEPPEGMFLPSSVKKEVLECH